MTSAQKMKVLVWLPARASPKNKTKTKKAYQHKAPSTPRAASVAEVIEPTFVDLSDKWLLSKCMMDLTQNNNEALHSVMWIITPKHLHHIPNVMLFAAALAIGRFNDGRNDKTIAAGEVPLFECTVEL